MARPPAVLPWSYSSLSAFETCPKRFFLTRISKQITEPQTAATMWGNQVHSALEHAVAGTTPLGANFKQYAPLVARIRAAPGKKHVEQRFGVTKGFRPTEFFGKDAWFRGVIDVTVVNEKTAVVMDYKSGKVKSDGDQLKLFAGAAFALYPWVETVKTSYLWLAHDTSTSQAFTREELPSIWQEFAPRVERMEAALESDKWMPRPSGLCKSWCPVGKRLCDFCGKD